MIKRISKQAYYLNIAEQVAQRSTCLKYAFGAVIVRDDEVVATGYNGAARGCNNCSDIGKCIRDTAGISSTGERVELCRSVHAEMNAIISAGRKSALGGVLYLVGFDKRTGNYYSDCKPCEMCGRFIINAGISRVICRKGKDLEEVVDKYELIKENNTMERSFAHFSEEEAEFIEDL
ncbi:MAG: cytidine deaminase [Oscillospiraceae bacterium]|jgi:dCMP deaminase|nr:cytidine deaminase [Oscillospiraceae bacterium]